MRACGGISTAKFHATSCPNHSRVSSLPPRLRMCPHSPPPRRGVASVGRSVSAFYLQPLRGQTWQQQQQGLINPEMSSAPMVSRPPPNKKSRACFKRASFLVISAGAYSVLFRKLFAMLQKMERIKSAAPEMVIRAAWLAGWWMAE